MDPFLTHWSQFEWNLLYIYTQRIKFLFTLYLLWVVVLSKKSSWYQFWPEEKRKKNHVHFINIWGKSCSLRQYEGGFREVKYFPIWFGFFLLLFSSDFLSDFGLNISNKKNRSKQISVMWSSSFQFCFMKCSCLQHFS